jgi:hypothetical protein
MLTQLDRLSIEADGRYASDRELQFIQDYCESLEARISAYEKVRDAEAAIFEQVETEKNTRNQDQDDRLFYLGSEDRSETCLRDMKGILRRCAATMLINDLDQMREAVLLWYQTIACAFNYERDNQIMYRFLDKAVKEYLTPEETELVKPFLQLNCTILV